MNSKPTLALVCILVPLLARSGTLDDYASLTGKTVLRATALPIPLGLAASDLPDEKTNAIATIEEQFAKRRIAVLQDGPHFVILFPEAHRGFLTNVLTVRGSELAAKKAQPTVPSGAINFINSDPRVFLSIYGDLSQRTIIRRFEVPPVSVTLSNTGSLSREEALYAMVTVLALNGIAVVEDGKYFAQVVPMAERSLVMTRAPLPEPNGKLLDPNELPSTGMYDSLKPVSAFERDLKRYQNAVADFVHYKPSDQSARRLLKLYAALADKRAEQSETYDGKPIWFHIQTPLSKRDLTYAIETTFRLNAIRILEAGERKVRLDRLSE